MFLKDFFDSWGWHKPPVLGDIYKKDDDLLRLFKFRDNLVENTIFLLSNLMNTRGIVVSGLPGVGKTTFLKYIQKKQFPEQMKIVSLAGRLGAVKPRDYVRVTEEQFLHIFSEVEQFLNNIIDTNNIINPARSQAAIREEWSARGNKLPFKEFARDILLPRCEQINKLD